MITTYAFDEIAVEAAIQRAYQQLICNPEKVLDWTDLLWPAHSRLFEYEGFKKLIVSDPLGQLVISLPRGASVQGDRVCTIITQKDPNLIVFITRFGNIFTVRKPDFSMISSQQLQKNVWVSGAAYLQCLNRALFLTGNTLEIGKLTGIPNQSDKLSIGPFPATLTCIGLINTSDQNKWFLSVKISSDATKVEETTDNVELSNLETVVFGDIKGCLHFLSISPKTLAEAEFADNAMITQKATLRDQVVTDSNLQVSTRHVAPRERQVYEMRYTGKTIPPSNFKRYEFAQFFLHA
ncbi:unnamed protein product [Schistocephalus solidus]|uniref:CNH domain-containing protein n=1 Tax=Schistocephalus solidus TaxID=70667 RepID=A0A183T653_SCHSO|nr:unnamed protein product [Schistocephalus solidus]